MLLNEGGQPFSLISNLHNSRCCQAASFKYAGTTQVEKFLSFLYQIFLVFFYGFLIPLPVASLVLWLVLSAVPRAMPVSIPFSVSVIFSDGNAIDWARWHIGHVISESQDPGAALDFIYYWLTLCVTLNASPFLYESKTEPLCINRSVTEDRSLVSKVTLWDMIC